MDVGLKRFPWTFPPPRGLDVGMVTSGDHTPLPVRIPGRLKEKPCDFLVEEILAYEPSGTGDHVYILVEKRELTTWQCIERLCTPMGVHRRDVGYAGMKDKQAVTRQWLSFPASMDSRSSLEATLRSWSSPSIRVLRVVSHGHKLRIGHVRANRFCLRVRGACGFADDAGVLWDALCQHGTANYFGPQRFGVGGDNLSRACDWLLHEQGRPPRDRRKRKLFVSSLQAAVFNHYVGLRTEEGSLHRALDGDVFQKTDTGGTFVGAASDQGRVDRWDVSPLGPMVGKKMRAAEGDALRLENGVSNLWKVSDSVLDRMGRDGLGTRRPVRMRPAEAELAKDGEDLVFSFQLGSGSYATVLMREVLQHDPFVDV